VIFSKRAMASRPKNEYDDSSEEENETIMKLLKGNIEIKFFGKKKKYFENSTNFSNS